MQVTKEKKDNALIVNVAGRLDANTAPSLEAEVAAELSDVKNVRFEIADLIYISSAGLRVLLTLHKAMVAKGGTFVIAHPCDEVMEILDMTGFSSFLVIEE